MLIAGAVLLALVAAAIARVPGLNNAVEFHPRRDDVQVAGYVLLAIWLAVSALSVGVLASAGRAGRAGAGAVVGIRVALAASMFAFPFLSRPRGSR